MALAWLESYFVSRKPCQQRKYGMDGQTVWQIRSIVVIKLLNTFTFFDYHCTSNHYLSSSTQASKSPLFATATANPPTLKGSSRVKTHLAFNQNPYHLMSASTFSSIACLYRRACFSKAIFHLGQVTCRSVQGYKRGISITRNKRILCILNTFSWLLGVNNKENGRSGIFLTTAEFRKILFWCAAATLRDDFHDKNLPRSKGQGINFVELPLFAAADFKLLPSIR